MEEVNQEYLKVHRLLRKRNNRIVAIALLIALLIAVVVFWWLKLVGITSTSDTLCNLQEHTHESSCYDGEELACIKPEHTHSAECFPEKGVDVENSNDWKKSFQNVTITNNVVENLVAIGNSQLGYKESSKNYEYDDAAQKQGYTRYGEWYGSPYGEWNTLYVSFCINYANIKDSDSLISASAATMLNEFKTKNLYYSAQNHKAVRGDVVFFDTNADNKADRTGIVSYNGEKVLIIMEGDVDGEVKTVVYKNTNGILGYGRTEKLGIAKYIEKVEEKTTETKHEPMELVGKVNRYIPKAAQEVTTFRLTRSSATENEALELMSDEDDHGISYSSDLQNELTKVTFKDQTGVEITTGSTVYLGEVYKITLEFSEINKGADWIQFRHDENGYLTYQLPANIHCERFDDWHTISAKTEQGTVQDVGEYFMDENGFLKVRFYDDANGVNFVDKFSNVDFTVDFSATVVATNPDGSTNIEFNDQFHVDVKVDDHAFMNITKKNGDYNESEHTMEYEIRVEATHGVLQDLVLDDHIWENHYVLRDTIVVTDLDGNLLDPQPVIGDSSIHQTEGATGGVMLSGFPDCIAGEGFLIQYKTKIHDHLMKNDTVDMWNGVYPTAQSPSGTPVDSKGAENWIRVELEKMKKNGKQAVITDANGNEIPVIEWEVEIRKDNHDLQGTVIIDTLGEGLAYYTGKDILVRHYDQWGWQMPDAYISWNDVTITNNSMSFALPDGYAFDIIYYTTYEQLATGEDKEFTNSIKATINGVEQTAGGTANVVAFVPNLKKTARGNDGENVYFTIETEVPAVLNNFYGFYLSDFAEFSGYPNDMWALYVDNVPQNMQITATRPNGEVVTFTPYIAGGKVEHTYILVAPADGNMAHTYQIFFNTDVADVASSRWLMDEDVKLTITYELPFDSKTGDVWFGELTGTESVGDVLLDGYTLTNQAYLMYGNNTNAQAIATATYNYSPKITKNSIVHESGVIDYTVRFYNTIPGTTAEGYIVSGVNDTWFNDTFDERLEYVPGSLVVTTYSPWNKSTWICKYRYNGAVSGNTIHVNARDFTFLDYNESSGFTGMDGAQNFQVYYQWMNSGGVYEFTYQLKLKNEYIFTTDYAKFELDNTAEVVWDNETSGPVTTTSEFYTGLLHKHVYQDSNKLDFEVHINRQALDVMEGTDVLTINDRMTTNLSVYWETIHLKYETSPDVWVDFNAPESEHTYTVTYDAAQNMLTFIVPDNLHIIISYTTLITESGYVGIENAVLVDGKEEVADTITAYFRVQEHSGGASGYNHSSTLLKHDGLTNAALPGAQFLLYGPKGDASATAPDGVARTLVVEDGTNLKYIGCYTTGADGTTIIESQYLTVGGPYALVEHVAPDGYERLEAPVMFYFYEQDPNGLHPTYTTLIPVENFTGSFLIPETGGMGAIPMATIGFALMAFPILYSLIRRKRERRLR